MIIEYYCIATLNSDYTAIDDNYLYYNTQSNKKKRIYIYDTCNKHIWCRINIINISKKYFKKLKN